MVLLRLRHKRASVWETSWLELKLALLRQPPRHSWKCPHKVELQSPAWPPRGLQFFQLCYFFFPLSSEAASCRLFSSKTSDLHIPFVLIQERTGLKKPSGPVWRHRTGPHLSVCPSVCVCVCVCVCLCALHACGRPPSVSSPLSRLLFSSF